MATPEQIEFIKKNAGDEAYMKGMQEYGIDLEKLTASLADKWIARIKAGSGNG